MLRLLTVALPLLSSALAQPASFTDPSGYPASWPADSLWAPYTFKNVPAGDATGGSGGDKSTGGTNPSGTVDVVGDPSIFYYGDGTNLFARFSLGGPPLALTGASQPYGSATWTVLIDTSGDGYKDFAIMLSGIDSGGSGNLQPDDLVVMYNNRLTQSINPATDTLWRQDSAKHPTSSSGAGIDGEPGESPQWDRDPDAYIWDFGYTRVIQLDRTKAAGSNNSRYYLDLQVPLAALDATAKGGPRLTARSYVSLAYTTANSNTNPAQKDFGYPGDYTFSDLSQPLPFGDSVSLSGGGTLQRPSIPSVSTGACSTSVPLEATVLDTLEGWGSSQLRTTVRSVQFLYYFDRNGNGLADDGMAWTSIGTVAMTATANTTSVSGGTVTNNISPWRTTWNSTGLLRGQYLVKAVATDDQGNVTDSVDTVSLSSTFNPTTDGVAPVLARFVNACGAPPPSLSKTASASQVPAGSTVDFTLTVTNTLSSPITVSDLRDALPSGFSYVSTLSSTLGTPTTSPAGGSTDTVIWTFSPGVSVPAGASRNLVFRAAASAVVGSYTNVASATTSAGTLSSAPVEIAVGAPRLTLLKSASTASAAPGDLITYTLTYANDSPASVTGATLTDALPTGLSFVSATGGGTYTSGTRTVSWNVGNLASGEGPFSVSFTARVDDPYPASAPVRLTNTATISSAQTSPASSSATTFINAPRPVLALQKSANVSAVSPGGNVAFTLTYTNTGNATATGVVLSDPLPSGFSFVSATGGGTLSDATVTWSLGSLAAGATGSVTVTMQAANPYSAANPQTNTASIVSAQTASVPASARVSVQQTPAACSNFFFRSATGNVGSAGTQRLAMTTQGINLATESRTAVGSAFVEFARFFQDPAVSADQTISGTMSGNLYVDKSGAPAALFSVQLFSYNPTTGATALLGESAEARVTGNTTNSLINYSGPVSGVLPAGHRLLWVVRGRTDHASNTNNLALHFGSSASPSSSNVCLGALPVAFNKKVSALTARPGGALTYTLTFGNGSSTALTGAQIVDTLPAGVSFQSATLNGASISPSVSGQTLTFGVNTSGAAAGTLAAGGSGTLVITVQANQPLSASVASLVNSASLQTAQLAPLSDTATTAVQRPDVSISKSADKTLLIPGDTVTYTLRVLNSGAAGATNVTVTDVLPVQPYFTFVPGSAALNGTPITPDPVSGGTLTTTLPSLASGASTTLTFRMRVATSGVPAGVTALDNVATVQDAQTSGTRSSAPVTVTVSSNPNLRLSKTVSAVQTRPGGDLTYTLTLRNEGASTARDVVLFDPIPANTGFLSGSIRYGAAAQTDADDADAGRFDAAANRVVVRIGDLPASGNVTATFSVRVNRTLPAGDTPITNTATVSPSNTASKTASVSSTATAAPALSLVKSAPPELPYPYTELAAAASTSTSVTVVSSAALSVGDRVSISGTVVQVVAKSASTLTLSAAVSAPAGTPLVPVFDYTLAYSNTGDASATNVVIQDALPAGLVFLSASPAASSAPAVGAGGTVSWNLGSVPAGASGTVSVRVRPSASGDYLNSATIASAETATVTSNSTTTQLGLLRVRKATSTPTVTSSSGGAEASYTISVENSRTGSATGVIVRDLLPNGFSYLTTTSIGGGGCTGLPSSGALQPTWEGCTVPGVSTLTITFTARVAPTVGAGTYDNDVEVSSPSFGVLPFDSVATTAEDVTVTVSPSDLTLTKSHVGNFTVGQTGTYSFSVNNAGGVASSGTITVTDTLPTGLTFVAGSTSGTGWTCSANTATPQTVTCTSSTAVAAAGSSTFSFNVNVGVGTAPGTNSVTNTASVSGGGDSNTANNSASDPTTVLSPNLTISKTHTGDFTRGTTGSYTITVGNTGTTATSGLITVVDTLPTGLTFVAGSVGATNGANWTCSASGQTLTCTSTTAIPIGGSSTFSFSVDVAASTAASVTNTVQVSGGGEATANAGNNSASDPTTTVSAADLTLTKSHAGSFTVGGTGTYSLTVSNGGGTASSGLITVTDALPTGLTFVSGSVGGANGSSWTCSASGQTVTCTSTAPIAAGGSSTFTFNVGIGLGTAPGTNSITNTAAVSGGGDANPANNSASDPTTVLSPDLTVTKTHTPSSFVQGGKGNYRIRVRNDTVNSTAQASGTITVTDTLPSGLSVLAGAVPLTVGGTAWSCTASGQVITCTRTGTITVGSTSTFNFDVNVASPAPASVTNQVTVSGGNEATANAGNNSASDLTPTVDAGRLTLVKTVRNVTAGGVASQNPNTGRPGDVLEYCLAYQNPGGSQVTNTLVSDKLPPDTTDPVTTVGNYGNQAIRWRVTAPSASTQNLSAAADADAGELNALLSVRVGTVPAGGAGDVCFRVTIR